MRDEIQEDSKTIHVKVTVQKDGDKFNAVYEPKIIQVFDADTIVNFKLVEPTPDDVVIQSVLITPNEQDQLSTPSISKNGRQMTLSDLNSLAQTFSLSFTYKNKHNVELNLSNSGEREIVYPQIENNPPGISIAMLSDGQPENNPPG
jgi:hypothetical protein